MRFDGDWLRHYPFRYEDLKEYERGVVVGAKNIYTRSGKTVQKISVKIGNKIRDLTYFNQPFLVKTLRPGVNVSLAGTNYEIIPPRRSPSGHLRGGYELIHTGRLVPVYPETKGVTSKMLRRRIYNLLKQPVTDRLPESIKTQYRLLDLDSALRQIHFPESEAAAARARRRLAFDELLEIQLEARAKRQAWQKNGLSHEFSLDKAKLTKLIKSLPFTLTSSQNQSLEEVIADLQSDKPMNRLLQGEVGSGKTVVAAAAMYAVYLNGLQAVLMAPTEILANQHYQTLQAVFAKTPVKIGLVTKSTKTAGDILVGTHALLFKRLDQLGLLVIDEQHRFGVKQRSQLLEIKPKPHLLSMTATPIPRTLALTIYAHLDLSRLEPIPGFYQQVKTWLVPGQKRPAAYTWIKQQIRAQAAQAFIVCPLINPSDKESMQDIKDITSEFERLKTIFAGISLGLIHGRLKSQEKNKIITAFSRDQIKVLVATPVIEVGIDIPRASIIVIENAERFGLAQLHQLRGRVGRRGQPAYCLLFSEKDSRRLKILETETSGIKLAESDLKLRGEGKVFGLEQHGFKPFKLADLSDLILIQQTRKAAKKLCLKNIKISDKIQPN